MRILKKRISKGAFLAAEDDVDAFENQFELSLGELADFFAEEVAIEGDDLRSIGNRVLGQSCRVCRENDVAGSVSPNKVAGERHAHD